MLSPPTPFSAGWVLAAFFYGYLITQIPGGLLAQRVGGKWVFGVGVVMTAILTLFTPLAAYTSVWLLVAVRVLEGFFEVHELSLLCYSRLVSYRARRMVYFSHSPSPPPPPPLSPLPPPSPSPLPPPSPSSLPLPFPPLPFLSLHSPSPLSPSSLFPFLSSSFLPYSLFLLPFSSFLPPSHPLSLTPPSL